MIAVVELVETWLFGALIEIIEDKEYLINELKKLNIEGYKIEISKKIKNGITGTFVDVILEHQHYHEHRNLNDINKIIDNSSLSQDIKDLAKRIFYRANKVSE